MECTLSVMPAHFGPNIASNILTMVVGYFIPKLFIQMFVLYWGGNWKFHDKLISLLTKYNIFNTHITSGENQLDFHRVVILLLYHSSFLVKI